MTTADKAKVPLVWTYNLGYGRCVVDNFGLYVKAMRGFYSASYSLLGDVGVYPVINSSSFTLDDFPSPVPNGNAEYITRDYQMSVSDFYINIWWPNMVKLADKYGLKYTGVVIENYENDTSGQVERQADTSRFTYFGNMLLQMGGEIGYHGYNHQPYSLSNVDYGDAFEYHVWPDTKAVANSLNELIDFTDNLFPTVEKSVYVPPSNILSPEARKFVAGKYPQIKVFEKVNQVIVPYSITSRRSGDIATCFADASRARKELGWIAEKSLEDMMRDSWKWQISLHD